MSNVQEQIDQLIHAHDVVLFMKGTKLFPQCGFSARAIEVLKSCGVSFKDVNVLADPDLRQGIKDYSNWPTIPQLYVKGEFLGGSDIVLEMFQSGELQQKLGVAAAAAPVEPPTITVTDRAAAAFKQALAEAGEGEVLRFDVSEGFHYDLYIADRRDGDVVVECSGLAVHLTRLDAPRAAGTTIDFVAGPDGAGFKIDNPSQPAGVRNITATELKERLDRGEAIHLFDVRGERERAIAKIDAARPLDTQALGSLDKGACVVLHCHHGVRSRQAAENLVADGFTNVHNLTGGIDSWSVQVDASVARY